MLNTLCLFNISGIEYRKGAVWLPSFFRLIFSNNDQLLLGENIKQLTKIHISIKNLLAWWRVTNNSHVFTSDLNYRDLTE